MLGLVEIQQPLAECWRRLFGLRTICVRGRFYARKRDIARIRFHYGEPPSELLNHAQQQRQRDIPT